MRRSKLLSPPIVASEELFFARICDGEGIYFLAIDEANELLAGSTDPHATHRREQLNEYLESCAELLRKRIRATEGKPDAHS